LGAVGKLADVRDPALGAEYGHDLDRNNSTQ